MSARRDAEQAYYDHRGLGPEHEGCHECDRLWQAVADAWRATYDKPGVPAFVCDVDENGGQG